MLTIFRVPVQKKMLQFQYASLHQFFLRPILKVLLNAV
jgi:hypothetical protein